MKKSFNKELFDAANSGNMVILKKCLKPKFFGFKKVDVNAKDEYGRTPLHLASIGGHTETVKMLIEKGIPCIDLIDFAYPDDSHRFWHTLQDTPDKCSPQSLGTVGRVLLTVIYDEKVD